MNGKKIPEYNIFPLLYPTKEEKENLEQFDIVRTKIKCNGKAQNVVIHDVCPYKFIAQETLDKLQIPSKLHPEPYFVKWTNRPTVFVMYRCLVPIKMSLHEDHIWCDAIPMNITHIPLGQPWLRL